MRGPGPPGVRPEHRPHFRQHSSLIGCGQGGGQLSGNIVSGRLRQAPPSLCSLSILCNLFCEIEFSEPEQVPRVQQ